MYDEIVKRLRNEAESPDNYPEDSTLMQEAADAIEELQKCLDGVEADNDSLCETTAELSAIREEQKAQIGLMVAKDKPRWIPVTERLPEKTNHYLVHVKCGCDGEIVSAWEQVAWFCEKFYWEHLHGDDVFEETITHWMPLPQPPKEEQ